MTYYNPAIYNYANLHREDQATAKVMYDIFKGSGKHGRLLQM